MYENTFTQAKDSRWGIAAPGWGTKIRKETLRRIEKIDSVTPYTPPTCSPPHGRRVKVSLPLTSPQTPVLACPALGWFPQPQVAPTGPGSHKPRLLACPSARLAPLQTQPPGQSPRPQLIGQLPWLKGQSHPSIRPAGPCDPSLQENQAPSRSQYCSGSLRTRCWAQPCGP